LALGSGSLRRAIKMYGGPVNAFAADVLGRSRVSVWRWLNGRETIPLVVVHRLKVYLQYPHPTHQQMLQNPLPNPTQIVEESPYHD
jgi:hypothetical protein